MKRRGETLFDHCLRRRRLLGLLLLLLQRQRLLDVVVSVKPTTLVRERGAMLSQTVLMASEAIRQQLLDMRRREVE